MMTCCLNLIVGDIQTSSQGYRHHQLYNDDSGPNKRKQILKKIANKDGRSTTQETEVDWLSIN